QGVGDGDDLPVGVEGLERPVKIIERLADDCDTDARAGDRTVARVGGRDRLRAHRIEGDAEGALPAVEGTVRRQDGPGVRAGEVNLAAVVRGLVAEAVERLDVAGDAVSYKDRRVRVDHVSGHEFRVREHLEPAGLF